MNDIEVSSIDLVEGGNVFKQGHYLTLGYVPRDEKGETVDLSGKTLNVSLWGRKGVVFEAAATYSGGIIRFTLDKMVPAGDYTVEFTVTSSTDSKYRKKFPTNQHSGRIAIKQSADDLGVVGIQVYTVAQLKAEQKALLDAAVSGFTVDSETKMARVSGTTTHPTIGARLEADKQATALQLAETVKKTETGVFDLNIFNDATRAAIQGIEPGTINAVLGEGNVEESNLANGVITFEKLNNGIEGLIKKTVNVLDKSDADFAVGFALNSNGNPSASANYQTSGFIKTISGNPITLSIDGVEKVPYRIAAYNENKVYITDTMIPTPTDYIVPSGASFIRLSYSDLINPKAQIEIGATATPFESPGYFIESVKYDANKVNEIIVKHDSGYLFSFNAGVTADGRSGICFVGDELWTFSPSLDDHSDYRSINKYMINLTEKTAKLVGSFKHNWGHTNSIAYSPQTDTIITGNGSSAYGTPAKIFLFPNVQGFKNFASVSFNSFAQEIDVTSMGWGDKLNVVWGDANHGKYNICYCITNDNKNIRKVMLGQGTNQLANGVMLTGKTGMQFNGTFKVLAEYSQEDGDDVAQGGHYENGKLYIGLGHGSLWYSINKLNKDGTITKELVEEEFYGDDGVKQNWVTQGITIKGEYLYIMCGYKVFVYKI